MDLSRFQPPFGDDTVRTVVEQMSHDWLRARRWFAEKSRRIARTTVMDAVSLSDQPRIVLTLVEVGYAEGDSAVYILPLLFSTDGRVSDALDSAEYQRLLFGWIARAARVGPVRFESFVELPSEASEPRLLGVEQSNTSVAYGREWILKNYRKLVYGQNRDLEVGRFLTSEGRFAYTPQVAGAISYGERATLGLLQRFVANQGDGWSYFRAQLQTLEEPAPNAPDDVFWAQDGLPDRAEALLDDVETLGRITGEMHQALGSSLELPDFAPERCSSSDAQSWLADLERQRGGALASAAGAALEDAGRRLLEDVTAKSQGLAERLRPAAERAASAASKIQIHGDYHLGQVLKTAGGFVIIDFEGEPARPLEERRAKQPALRDVAGMLRSLDYAAGSLALEAESAEVGRSTEAWAGRAGRRFLSGWRGSSGQASDEDLLRLFQLGKAFYELNYELNNRPHWAIIPLRGLARLLEEVGA